MKQMVSHEMRIRDAIGGTIQITLRELYTVFLCRQGLGFLAIAILSLWVSDHPGLLDRMSLFQALPIWVFSLIVYLTLYTGVLAVSGQVQRRFNGFVIYLPIVSCLAMLPSIQAAEAVATAISGVENPPSIERVILDFLTAQSFELVFVRFALPYIRALRASSSQPPKPQLRLGSRVVDLDRLRHMEAQEHYVRLTLDTETILHRARLSDLIAQTNKDDGCQPHRSWWVARSARPAVGKQKNRIVLNLGDGTVVPVARGRQQEVQAWIETPSRELRDG